MNGLHRPRVLSVWVVSSAAVCFALLGPATASAQHRLPAGARLSASRPVDRSISRSSSPERTDAWLGRDKVRHFGSSAAIQLMGYGLVRVAGMGRAASFTLATALTAVAGIGKELRDARRGGDPSIRDLVADGAGIVAGTGLVMIGDPREPARRAGR